MRSAHSTPCISEWSILATSYFHPPKRPREKNPALLRLMAARQQEPCPAPRWARGIHSPRSSPRWKRPLFREHERCRLQAVDHVVLHGRQILGLVPRRRDLTHESHLATRLGHVIGGIVVEIGHPIEGTVGFRKIHPAGRIFAHPVHTHAGDKNAVVFQTIGTWCNSLKHQDESTHE